MSEAPIQWKTSVPVVVVLYHHEDHIGRWGQSDFATDYHLQRQDLGRTEQESEIHVEKWY